MFLWCGLPVLHNFVLGLAILLSFLLEQTWPSKKKEEEKNKRGKNSKKTRFKTFKKIKTLRLSKALWSF